MKNSWKTLAVLCCLALIEAAAQVAVGPLDNGTVSATLFAGSDQGAQVNAALTASSNLKVSAEGFTGTLNSASNPIPGGQRGKLALGCNQVWQTKASWVFPSGFVTEGCGWSGASALNTGTVIRAVTGFPTMTATPIGCTGDSGTCANGTTDQFGIMIRSLVFDCNGITLCIGFQNMGGQEGCCLDWVKILNFPNIGLDVEGSRVQNSRYSNLYIQEQADDCLSSGTSDTTGTLALKINTPSNNVTVQRATLTYNSGSGSCHTFAPKFIAKISAVAFTGIDMHFEPGTGTGANPDTSGLCIGCDGSSAAVTLVGLSFAGFATGSSSCETFATCGVLISSTNTNGYVTLSGVNCSSTGSTGLTYCLYDHTNNYNSLVSNEGKVGFYSSGNATLKNALSTNLYLPQTSTQLFSGSCDGQLAVNTNSFMFGLGGKSTAAGTPCNSTAVPSAYPPVTGAGFLDNLYVNCGTGPAAGTPVTFTVLKNGTAQTVTCTISNPGTSCNDNISSTAHSFTVSPGDGIGLKMKGTNTVSESTADCRASIEKH